MFAHSISKGQYGYFFMVEETLTDVKSAVIRRNYGGDNTALMLECRQIKVHALTMAKSVDCFNFSKLAVWAHLVEYLFRRSMIRFLQYIFSLKTQGPQNIFCVITFS